MSDHFISSFGQKPPALGQLRINPELGQERLDALKKLGHKLVVRSGPLSAAPSVIGLNRPDWLVACCTPQAIPVPAVM